MINFWSKVKGWLGREDGNSTIEFVIWFPFFIGLFGSAFEASFISLRQTMLNGAVDRTVRELQLGYLVSPTHTELKKVICNYAGFIPNCLTSMHIEQEVVQTSNFNFRKGAVQCIDVDNDVEPSLNYVSGAPPNDLVLLTVCAAVRPMVPITGLGLSLPKINGGKHYAIVAFSAYVVEP